MKQSVVVHATNASPLEAEAEQMEFKINPGYINMSSGPAWAILQDPVSKEKKNF